MDKLDKILRRWKSRRVARDPMDKLADYRDKRSVTRTAESWMAEALDEIHDDQ